jgi:hypothetical protein
MNGWLIRAAVLAVLPAIAAICLPQQPSSGSLSLRGGAIYVMQRAPATGMSPGALPVSPGGRIVPGPLRFTIAFGPDASTGHPLPVPLISQYQGIATDNFNCGPASVAAVLRARVAAVGSMDNSTLVAKVRAYTGEPAGDTDLPGLRRALAAFGVPSVSLLLSDGGGNATDPLAAVHVALQHGAPVLALVDGATFGRGTGYGDHFIVIRGMDVARGMVDVVDPDTQQPRSMNWLPGGLQALPARLVRQALRAAAGPQGIAALAIGSRDISQS